MHSSRMRTARLLPASPSMHCSRRGVYLVGGYLVLGGYLVPEGVPGLGGVPGPGWGVYLPRYSPCGQNDRHL